MEKRALLPSLLTTGVLVLSLLQLVVTQGLQLADSVLDPPADQLSANPALDNPNRYNLNAGAAFTISCTFTYTSSDLFTVSFYKDGMVIRDGDLANTALTDQGADTEQTLALAFSNFQPAHDGVYHCSASTSDTNEEVSSDPYLYGSADPPPSPVRVTPRYVVLDNSADLVLEARFRGNFYSNDWVYSEDDPTFMTNPTSVFDPAAASPVTITNVGQTYTIPAGSASLAAGYYGPSIVPTEMADPMQPTPENTVIVGSFVAPSVLINGAATNQVVAAVGEDVTFTCTARGFPETTLTIQLSGVDASDTIGEQTLMTEATPTSPMEVTRTVTLKSVTVLDCGAVVTCMGSNMDSDGSTHTDQATATLQVQVGVTPSESVLSVGDPLMLTCTGGDCVGTTTFTFSWLLDGNLVDASLVTGTDGTTSQLSVTSVTSADFGTYTCQAMSIHGTGEAVAYVREAGSLVFTTDLTAPPMASLHSSLMDGETNRYNIEPNAAFSLTCTAESPDDEDFTLTVLRMPSSVTSAFTHSVTKSSTTMPTTFVKTQTLNYSPFTSDLNGIYWCRAVSSTTSNVLESRRILLGTGPATVTPVSDLYVELIPPNPLELQVMVAGAYESLTWSHGGMELVEGGPVSFTNFRQTLSISSTSSGEAGEYTAALSADSVTFQVQEFSAPQSALTAPTYVIHGDTLTVNCSVTSFPQSSVSMSFGDTTPIVTSVPETYDSTTGLFSYFTTYSTTAMYPSDEGNYTCSATITHGQPAMTDVYSEAVFVSVYVPPEVNITAESVVDETNPAVLTCVATGVPEPNISWSVDTMSIDSDDIKYSISTTTRVLDSQNIEVTSTLTVFDTSVDDSGIYSCESVNLAGSAMDTTELTVQAAPLMLTINVSPSTVVPQGTPLNLTCVAVGAPAFSVTWTTPTGMREGSLISIDSVTADNAGAYTCVVTSEGRTANDSVTIGVHTEIDGLSFQDLYAVNEGQNVTFSCSAFGVPAPSLSWRRDGMELSPSSDSRVVLLPEMTTRVNYTGPVYRTTRMLTFTNVMDSDTRNTPGNMYQCVAVNTVGGGSSVEESEDVEDFTLFVRVAPTFIQDLAPMSVTFPANLELACTATARPRPNITWYKDGVELMEGGQVSITSKEVGERVLESNLTVSSPFLEGIGSYICMAENVVDVANSTAEVVIFSQPFIRGPPVDLTVNQSSPATFSCTAQGNPVPTISWTGPSDNFTTEDTPGANFTVLSVLTIDSAVRARHEGLYTCSASNGVGPSPNSSATLTVQVPPTVQAVQRRIVGIQQMSVTLAFIISDASPEVQTENIQWTFRDLNGNSFDIPTGSLTTTFSNLMGMFSGDRLSLTLSGLNNSFEGMYTMTATNEAGSDSAVVELVIEGPPRIIRPPVSQQVVNGVDVTFDCYALAEPLHSLTWYFTSANGSSTTIGSVNGTENMITDNGKYQITDTSSSSNDYGRLLVRDVQFEDRGTYMCLAENRHGPDTATAPLSVQVPPMFLSTSPQVDIVINSTDAVTLNCFIQGYPLMLLRWMKDGTPLDPDSSHINIATFRRQDPTDTYPFSSSMDSSFQPIPVEGLEYFEAVSELTLVPPLLRSDTANYTCEVGAVFVQNYSQTSDNIPIFILEVPDAPVNVTITNNAQRSQVLSWVAPFDGNRPITQNIIYFSSSRQPNLTQIYPPLGEGRNRRQTSGGVTDPVPSVNLTDDLTTVIVSNLIPFVDYSYTVVAVNELGRSDMSQPSLSVQTEAAAPDFPPQRCVAMATSSTSFGVAWSSPDPPNGIIANYTIVYRPVDAVADYDPSTFEGSTTNYTEANITMLMAVGLQSAVFYSIQLAATNQIGISPFSRDLECTVLTEDDVPGVPQSVNVISPSSTSLLVTWDHPLAPDRNGVITGYTVIRQKGSEINMTELFSNDTSQLLTGLVPFTEYNITVAGNTSVGQGEFTVPVIMRTLNDTASPPLCPTLTEVTADSLDVSWYPPNIPRGDITDYQISLTGSRHYNRTFTDSRTLMMSGLSCGACSSPPPSCPESSAQADQCIRCTVPGLSAATNYTVTVAAVSGAGLGAGSSNVTGQTMVFNPPPDPLPMPTPEGMGLTVPVPIVRCSQLNGPISHYQIVVVAYSPGMDFDRNRKPNNVFAPDRFVPYVTSTPGQDQLLVYVAAEFAATLFPDDKMFTLGSADEPNDNPTYTNPALSYSTAYTYFVICLPDTTPDSLNDPVGQRVSNYALAGYSSFGSEYVTPAEPLNIGPVVGGVVVALVLVTIIGIVIIIVIIIVMRRRRNKYDVDYQDTNGRGSAVPVFMALDDEKETRFERDEAQPKKEIHLPIAVTDLPQALENLKRDDNRGFQVEYQSIKDNSPQHPVTNFKMAENKIKNRYGNIMCYDTTRVVLKNVADETGADYINANHLAGYNREKEYIASQGPLPGTIGDFWRMVWEQDARTIVMLTQVIEGTKVKCQQYWPSTGENTFGSFVVKVVETCTYAQYTVRTIDYYPAEEPGSVKTVRQFHFTAWPDFGVPLNGGPLLKFLLQVRKHHEYSNPKPLLVHCSAGVGRTGTFIGLDVELQRANREGVVDPYNFVLHMRDQRNLMVQTESQYIFLYETIMEGITHDYDEFPVTSLKQRLAQLEDVDQEGLSGAEKEFRHLVSTAKVDIRQFSDANADANKFKNRFMNFLPYNFSRVLLEQQPGVDGSDYINASYVDGYREKAAFIATQGPLPATVQDFWRMVWEKNTACVVMLTQLVENGIEMCSHYWPAAGEKKQCGKYLTVELTEERAYEDYVHRDFKITFTDEVLQASESRSVSQFHFLAWPERGSPQTGAGMIDLIDQVRRVQMKTSNNAILVHCSNGTGRTGSFIGLSVALEHVRTEGMVDVYGIVKNLRTQRPHMVQTLEQYIFCYSTIAEYVESMSSYDNFQ